MKQCYKCDFCGAVYENELTAEEHEEKCGYNPKNKITNKLVFRLSMIYEALPKIISCALYEVAKEELDFLYAETERATEENCPYTIKLHQGCMLGVLGTAQKVTDKHKGRNSSTYKDVVKENPELLRAIIATLERKAWNER